MSRDMIVNTNPTEAQKKAGNYKMGHIKYEGMDVTIENPAGSTRSGISPDGKKWTSRIYHHYGFLKRTLGKDGDHVDVFIKPKTTSTKLVFVINQVNPGNGHFDEHKCMLGFDSAEEAEKAYLKNYEKGWKGVGSISTMTIDEFKDWVYKGKRMKPAAEPIEKKAAQVKIPEGGLRLGLLTNDLTQVMTAEDAKKVKENLSVLKRSGPGVLPMAATGAISGGLLHAAISDLINPTQKYVPMKLKGAIAGAALLGGVPYVLSRMGLYDKQALGSAKKLIDKSMEKKAAIGAGDLFTVLSPITPGASFGRNVAGDVAHKMTPTGGKIKAEKSGRRYGLIGGGAASAIAALALLKKKGKLAGLLSKHLDPDATNLALGFGIPIAATGAGWLSGYPIGAASSLAHRLTSKNTMEKKANMDPKDYNRAYALSPAMSGLQKQLTTGVRKVHYGTGDFEKQSDLLTKLSQAVEAYGMYGGGEGMTGLQEQLQTAGRPVPYHSRFSM